MAKKQQQQLCTVTFPVVAVPYGLGMVLQYCSYPTRASYFANDEPKVTFRPTDDAPLIEGYEAIFAHILSTTNTNMGDGEKAILNALFPLMYSPLKLSTAAESAGDDNTQAPEEAAEKYVSEHLDAILGNKILAFVCGGSPLLHDLESEDLARYPNCKKVYEFVYTENASIAKPSVGQVSVALKRYERERIGSGPALKDAVMGKVCTRFPPEPSGYIHIGHAKAALLNHYFARLYNGRLHFRLDDTNPAKERGEFVENMHRDLKTLGIDYNTFSHTSDHFEYICKRAKELISRGMAYCDQTPAEEMQRQRLEHEENAFRAQSVEENMRLFEEMLKGSEEGQKTCLRAKIDMAAVNGCMRDPVMYRVNITTPHNRTGTTWKAYPTYDFACPIVDSIEGITHALRTTEFLDRNEQYQWFCKALGLRCPKIQDFSRFNLQYSIMSKRHLQWFVDQGIVDGWFDPRFPTIQGLVRRGLQMPALRAFILEQGASRKINYQEWEKIWAVNKSFIEPMAKRFQAVHTPGAFTLKISGGNVPEGEGEYRDIPCHPKDATMGTKRVLFSRNVLIDRTDAEQLIKALEEKPEGGVKITLMGWGNLLVTAVDHDTKCFEAKDISEEDKNFENTLKLTWLAKQEETKYVQMKLKYFGHLVTKAILGKDDDFKDYVNKNSLMEQDGIMDENVFEHVKKGDVLQIERWGFYYVDDLDKESKKITLHYVPEGKQNQQAGAFSFEQ